MSRPGLGRDAHRRGAVGVLLVHALALDALFAMLAGVLAIAVFSSLRAGVRSPLTMTLG